MPGNVSMINKDQQMPNAAMPITPGPGAGVTKPGSMLGEGSDSVGNMLTTLMLMDRMSKNNKGGSSGSSGGGIMSLLGGKGGGSVGDTSGGINAAAMGADVF